MAVADPFLVTPPRRVRLGLPGADSLRRVAWVDRVAFAGVGLVTLVEATGRALEAPDTLAKPLSVVTKPTVGRLSLSEQDVNLVIMIFSFNRNCGPFWRNGSQPGTWIRTRINGVRDLYSYRTSIQLHHAPLLQGHAPVHAAGQLHVMGRDQRCRTGS